MNVDQVVHDRYSAAAKVYEPGLCCPASYDPKLLEVIPDEVIERDYGCGDPSPHLRPGETVLDLGSGGGKLCFIAAQVVGAAGRVVGVDFNDEMLALARRAQPRVAEKLGYSNVEFHKGRIEQLDLDYARIERYLQAHPLSTPEELALFEEMREDLRSASPLIPSDSIDVVVSNCVLNLLSPGLKPKMFEQIHRVLKRGGRVVLSDVVADEDVPPHLMADPELWGGCYSGAIREDRFINAFSQAGLHGTTILHRDAEPYHVIDGVELRKMTVVSYKGKEGECWDHKQAVVYRGPFRRVEDDDGHVLVRGHRVAVCDKTFRLFQREPYGELFEFIEPEEPLSPEQAARFDCTGIVLRDPRETKNRTAPARPAAAAAPACGPECCC